MNNEVVIIDLITELELANEKASYMVNDLNQEYFGDAEPDSAVLACYYREATVKTQIASDYIFEAKKKLEKLKTIIEK